MNIWLNPKYSKTMGAHAGKILSFIKFNSKIVTNQ